MEVTRIRDGVESVHVNMDNMEIFYVKGNRMKYSWWRIHEKGRWYKRTLLKLRSMKVGK